MERKEQIRILFQKYLANQHTRQELDELLSYFDLEEDKITLTELINSEIEKNPSLTENKELINDISARVGSKIFAITRPKTKSRKLLPWISVAAMLVLAISSTYYFIHLQKELPKISIVKVDVAPGSNKAILILSDGTKMDLAANNDKKIIADNGTIINSGTKGQLSYTSNKVSPSNSFNSIITPKGGEYQVRLPDGTKVWLNAASSLKYPTSFANAKERLVELSGEAYFEVAHNRNMPFRVKTASQTVEVLGTHFNINSYSDENNTVTTLIEGSVRVNNNSSTRKIIPGQQSIVSATGISVQQADMETALAWKNGAIIFKSASIEAIMKQIERWYDVKVEYVGKLPDRVFSGGIPRNSKLSVLLSILKDSGVQFEIRETAEGKKLIVKP